MACGAGECCSLENEQAERLNDPTLSSCCRKDILEQRREARLFEKLSVADRSNVRINLGRAAYCTTAPAEPSSPSASSLLSDDEDQSELQHLRDLRLQELKQAARQHSELWAAGRGCLQDMKEAAALEDVRKQNGATVLHLCSGGDPVGQEMDELLSRLAAIYLHTRFVRVVLNRASRLPPQLGLPHASALLCFQDGAHIGKMPTSEFQDGGHLLEEKVTKWLRLKKTLKASPASQAAAEGKDLDSDEEAQEEVGDWTEPCEICGRRFHHEHVRAVYSNPEFSDEDSD